MKHVGGANPNYLWLKERGNDYGDWLAIGSTTSKDLIATAYWAYDASLMMRMAHLLDRPADEQKYGEVFEKVRAAFNAGVREARWHSGNREPDQLRVGAAHEFAAQELRAAVVAEKLVADIKAHDWHLDHRLSRHALLDDRTQQQRSQ